ncbi:MAG TPA: hypothetical protein VFV94_13290 [Polyangiaceae bacterium]|nr:hypothetical protein [Polyangiaceae bacterium]
MKIRYSLALVALAVACGGSSKTEPNGGGNGSGDDTSGASGTGGSTGAKGGTPNKGGTSSQGGTAGASLGASGGVGGAGAAPGGGGDFGGLPGAGGDAGTTSPGAGGTGFGASAGVAGSMGPNFGEVCNEDGCLPGDPTLMPLEPSGPIHCGGTECAAGEACCMTSGKCFDPEANAEACPRPPKDDDQQGRRTCSSKAHCDPLYFCELEYGQLCGSVGHCQPISNCGVCGGGDNPSFCRLCGCDGNTYPNVQTACLAGTAIAYQGAGCGETVQEGGGGAAGAAGSAGSAGSSNTPPRIVTPCGTNDDCTQTGELCCPITNRCYPKDDAGQCVEPPEGTRFPCTSNAQCQDYEYCAGEGCDTPGGCKQRGSGQCGVIFAPVCGCDGVSYTSGDCAIQSGTRVKSDGQCPEK